MRTLLEGIRYLVISTENDNIFVIFCHLGAPGSGKGTISNWVVRDFALKHVSSGDLLRQHMKDGTPVGKDAKKFVDQGALVPDEVMVNLISTELKALGDQPWLLDGFPRTKPQAEALQKEAPINVVINLDVPFETIIDRVKGMFQFIMDYFDFTKDYQHFSFFRSLGSSRIWKDL